MSHTTLDLDSVKLYIFVCILVNKLCFLFSLFFHFPSSLFLLIIINNKSNIINFLSGVCSRVSRFSSVHTCVVLALKMWGWAIQVVVERKPNDSHDVSKFGMESAMMWKEAQSIWFGLYRVCPRFRGRLDSTDLHTPLIQMWGCLWIWICVLYVFLFQLYVWVGDFHIYSICLSGCILSSINFLLQCIWKALIFDCKYLSHLTVENRWKSFAFGYLLFFIYHFLLFAKSWTKIFYLNCFVLSKLRIALWNDFPRSETEIDAGLECLN